MMPVPAGSRPPPRFIPGRNAVGPATSPIHYKSVLQKMHYPCLFLLFPDFFLRCRRRLGASGPGPLLGQPPQILLLLQN